MCLHWMIEPTLGWLTKKYNIYMSHDSSFTQLFFSRVRGQASQGVLSFRAVKKISLLNWFCGLKATHLHTVLQRTQPDSGWGGCAHIFSLFSSIPEMGEHKKASLRRVWNPPWRKKKIGGPSISLAFFQLPRWCDAHKGSRQAGKNQFCGAHR